MAKLSGNQVRIKKHFRIRKKLDKSVPRIVVFKSLKNIEVQLVDDMQGKTLVASSSLGLKLVNGGNIEAAKKVGLDFGNKISVMKKLSKVVFDRSGYKYHGRIKALAEGIKERGVKF